MRSISTPKSPLLSMALLAGLLAAVAAAAVLAFPRTATAQEATIRKTLAERLPKLKIEEIGRTPIPGLWEVRYDGYEILYTDDKGEYVLIEARLVDTKTRTDLTEQRIEKLLAVDFDKLPLKDAIVFKQGTGARRMAVFVDPNCGYCKRFERDVSNLKDVTVYTFLLPILGADSTAKSRDIWCAKDPASAWRGWMLDNTLPPKAAAGCNTAAIDRVLEFGQKHRVNSTPSVFFNDGTRKPGAMPADLIEKMLVAAAAKKS